MKRYMFCGYPKGVIKIKGAKELETSSVAYYGEMAFLYYECREEMIPEQVAEGDMVPFPDGSSWWRMPEIFHYFSCENEELWRRKVAKKTPVFRINYLKQDKIASYIYYHFEHQETNQIGCDRYGSIYCYQNLIIMYTESPTEKVKWIDIEGKCHRPGLANWDALMEEHFNEWEDGSKGWRSCYDSRSKCKTGYK